VENGTKILHPNKTICSRAVFGKAKSYTKFSFLTFATF